MIDFDQRYMQKVLALHDEMGLERDNDPETRLWHLLRSMIEFCDAQRPRIGLDLLLETVRDDYRAQKEAGLAASQ